MEHLKIAIRKLFYETRVVSSPFLRYPQSNIVLSERSLDVEIDMNQLYTLAEL